MPVVALMLTSDFSILFHLVDVVFKSLSRVQLFATPWTVARQAPLSMRLSRQK